MPDEFDDALTQAVYGWDMSTLGWCGRRQVGAAQGYYCNLCGDKLSDDRPTWPIIEVRQHRERYRGAVEEIQARRLIALNQNEDQMLRLYTTGLLFPEFDALDSNGTDHPRHHVAPLSESLGRMGGLMLGSIICLSAGYRVLAASHLDLPHFATALRLAVERGPDFFEAIEAAAEVEGLLQQVFDQQMEGVPVWPNY